jgi:group I intron endonuclease
MIGIYKIISPSGKIYIGQSKDLHRRKGDYNRYSKKSCRQVKLIASINKYGWSNHVFEIIEVCSVEELSIKERFWQEYYDSIEHGLNCIYVKTEEKAAVFSSDSRLKMRNAQLGKKRSAECKENMSKAKTGKLLSQETKEKISKALLGKTKNLSKEGHQRLIVSNQNKQNKRISCKNPNGDVVVFNSFKDAAKTIGVSPQAIQNVVHRIKSKTGKCQNWSDFKIVESKKKEDGK